jgi:hypothetical protein
MTKTYSAFTVCGLTAIAVSGLWGLSSSWGQEGASNEERNPKPAKKIAIVRSMEGERSYGGYGEGGRGYGGGGSAFFHKEDRFKFGPAHEQMHAIREAAEALSAAEDDEAKDEAQEKLSGLLNEYFEEDMKRREEELASVEKRVRQLRELLERRRDKKDDIIELQTNVLRNEADGLGFFSGEGPGGLPGRPHPTLELRLDGGPHGPRSAVPALPPGHPAVHAAPRVEVEAVLAPVAEPK